MSAAPRTQQPQARPHTGHDIRRFVHSVYGDRSGYVEVCYINGDPLHDDMKRARWFYYTPDRLPALVQFLQTLVRRYGNVYISRTLYAQRRRDRQCAFPSRVVFVDDAPEHPELMPSIAVRTSAGSRHAIYLLDREYDTATSADLQCRAAHALHADKSGADIEQLIRIPESYNTKNGGRYPVNLEHCTQRTYTADQLRTRWPAVETHAGSTAIDWQDVAHWLANISQLLGRDGLPRRLTSIAQGRRILDGTLAAPSTSDARAFVCRSLIMHHYPDAEIAALLIHFCDYGAIERKGSDWLYKDIERLIGKERARQPHVTVNDSRAYLAKPAQPLQAVPRRTRGRPIRLTADALYAYLERNADGTNGVVMQTQPQLATAHKVSVPTIRRLIAHLKAQDRVTVEVVRKGRQTYSYVVLSAIKNTQAPALSVRSAPTEISHETATNCTNEASIKEHTPEIAPPAEPIAADASIRLADAVRAAVEAVAAAQRPTFTRFLATFREYFPQLRMSDKPLKREYDRVLNERRRERTLDKERQKAASAEQHDLERWAKSYAWNHAQAVKDGHDRKAYMWGCKLAVLEQEIERRQAAGEWLDKKSRRRKDATPVPAPAPLLEFAEAEPLAPEDDGGLSGGVFLPHSLEQ